jgi:SAM-dependent methyltransferase
MADTDTQCRSCGESGLRPFLQLGKTPLADALVASEAAGAEEATYALDVAFCEHCSQVQILEALPEEVLFGEDYPYFSSFSDELLTHSAEHVNGLVQSRGLTADSLLVEIASNDGYLLRAGLAAGIGVLGVEPTPGPAAAARKVGVPTMERFFGIDFARELVDDGVRADVIVANNVMAHVPDLNGFVAGMAHLLTDDGVITVENPYVKDLVERLAFDTIYHEHIYYHSCTSVDALARRHGLFLNHVEYFPDLHAGTLRWWLGKKDEPSDAVREYLANEKAIGLTSFGYYADFADRVTTAQTALREALTELKGQGRTIAAYGAAAKGSTLLNTSGIDNSLIDFVVDRNPNKQGKFMPGVGIPVLPAEALLERKPDVTLILAWNFAREIAAQQTEYTAAGGRFMTPLPTPEML